MSIIQNIQGSRITGSISGVQYTQENTKRVSNIGGDYTTLAEAITAINNMSGTTGVRLLIDAGTHTISDTININSTRPIYIEGAGINVTNVNTNFYNKPLFNVYSSVNIEKITFNGPNSTGSTENCINYLGNNNYEISDFAINNFYNALNVKGTGSNFIFNYQLNNIKNDGICINSTGMTTIDVEVGNFTNVGIGIHLSASTNAIFDVHSNFFYLETGQTGIKYEPTTYTYSDHPSIVGNKWNNNGTLFSGFDFTRTDARDANIVIMSNTGSEDKTPHFFYNLTQNTNTQNLTQDVWTKLNFSASTYYTTKFKVEANKITYQPSNKRDIMLWGSGSLKTTTSQSQIDLVLVKNGNTTGITYGIVSVYLDQNNRQFNWSANAYISDLQQNDYIEVYAKAVGNNETIIFEDFNWLGKCQ